MFVAGSGRKHCRKALSRRGSPDLQALLLPPRRRKSFRISCRRSIEHVANDLKRWMTLVLFRTRRRDECSRLREGVRRRVRKSRQKEAAGAAGAGLMQIEWRERGWRSSLESKKPSEEKPAHLCEHGSRAEVSLGGDSKKIFGRDGGALRRGALKRADNAVCGRVISCSRG
jgi:hypothetical protein